MEYMNAMHCPYRIVIADGGDDKILEAHLSDYKNYRNLEYEYIRYPFDATLDDYFNKLENVISRVETDYILQADNDDFYLLERIPELIAFLDEHPDYVAARGVLVNFEVYDNKGITKAQLRGLRYQAFAVDALSIENDCPLSRIDEVCHGMADYDYYSNWYSVTRTGVLQKIWKDLLTLPIREVIVLEILTHVMLMHAGKLKVISAPFYVRQSNTSEFGETLILDNQFLERCLSNNAFSDFSIAVDRFLGFTTIEERKAVLKSIAGWLNSFVFYNRRGGQVRAGLFFRLWSFIKRDPYFGPFVKDVFGLLKSIALQTPRRRGLRIEAIEPFVLECNHTKGRAHK